LRKAIEDGQRVQMSTIVLYEWLRGPRRAAELSDQEALFARVNRLERWEPRAGVDFSSTTMPSSSSCRQTIAATNMTS
jgi:hypothetical protein